MLSIQLRGVLQDVKVCDSHVFFFVHFHHHNLSSLFFLWFCTLVPSFAAATEMIAFYREYGSVDAFSCMLSLEAFLYLVGHYGATARLNDAGLCEGRFR